MSSIEWLYNGQVIESAEGAEAVLVIEVVSDLLHDRDYTCRSRARFGNEERAFRIQVEGQLILSNRSLRGLYISNVIIHT